MARVAHSYRGARRLEARDLVEAGACELYDNDPDVPSWSNASDFAKKAYMRAARNSLIATFRKLAEDGPTDAMVEAAAKVHREDSCEDDESLALAMLSAGLAAIGRELEGLTP